MGIAVALAIALPATGLIIAVVAAVWRDLDRRLAGPSPKPDTVVRRLHEPSRRLDGGIDERGRRLGSADWRLGSIDRKFDSIDRSLDSIEAQMEEILCSLKRIEDHFDTQAPGRRRHLRLVTLDDPPEADAAEAT